MDSYYDEQIERYEEQRAIAVLAMNVCASIMKLKNERSREKIRRRIIDLQTADVNKLGAVSAKLSSELSKVKEKTYVPSHDVEKIIDKLEPNYKVQLDYNKRYGLASEIGSNPVVALRSYSNQYVAAKRTIERLKKEKEESKNRKNEQEKQQVEEQRYDGSYGTFHVNPTPTYGTMSTTNVTTPVPFGARTDTESKNLIKTKIDEKITAKFESLSFSYDEVQKIKELYPEFDSYNEYVSIDTLKEGIKIERIANKKSKDVKDIMDMGLLVLDVVKKELLHGTSEVEPDLFSKLGMKNSLEKYKKAYDKFMLYYKSLNPTEKNKVDKIISEDINYTSRFGDKIATPDTLKDRINHEVINYVRDNYTNYYYGCNVTSMYSKTMHLSKYMSVEDVSVMYHEIVDSINNYGIYARDDEERKRIVDGRRETIGKFQESYSQVILSKLQHYNKEKNIEKMSDVEKEQFFHKLEEQLASICVEILKEQPVSEAYSKYVGNSLTKETGENLKGTYEAKKEASARVYGLSSVKKAFAQMSGKWSRYLMLMDKEELTKSEQDELRGMFR